MADGILDANLRHVAVVAQRQWPHSPCRRSSERYVARSARQHRASKGTWGTAHRSGRGRRNFRFRRQNIPHLSEHHRERRAADASAKSDRNLRWRFTKFPPERRSLTGRSRVSGTSVTRTSRMAQAEGRRLCPSNLHVMSYSVPVRKRVSLAELKKHVHTLPEQPDLIPYRTSYYAEDWAFCMAHRQLECLREGAYEVVINSSLENGYLTYGEYLHKGETNEEFLLSAHICHPSLANDNCSGVALLDASCPANGRITDAVQLQISFRPRDYRGNRLVGAQRRE